MFGTFALEYISCFSGIGGLEASQSPIACCEIDLACQTLLANRFPDSEIFRNIKDLRGITAPVICGGWPCQDLSVAGLQEGLHGRKSRLFFDFVGAAKRTQAQTIIAENVPNLLTMSKGAVFREVVKTIVDSGFTHVAWRVLNARNFGLPHQRRRVFIVASSDPAIPRTIHRKLPEITAVSINSSEVGSFYWTAGSRSICYSVGFIPTLKVGSSLSIPSPPAIFYDGIVRQLSGKEALKLQGFDTSFFESVKEKDIYRMSGNAVAAPVGKFVVDGVLKRVVPNEIPLVEKQGDLFGERFDVEWDGLFDGEFRAVKHQENNNLASNLADFIDWNSQSRLSTRASGGLLRRLDRSGQSCPAPLRNKLTELAVVHA
jgi:DNA (cytosine-5)-methyltransferase 1